jgi:hypothetical protein
MASKIFISYRRDDSAGTAGRLHDRLAERFGQKNLFFDVDNVPVGTDFVEYLGEQVANCDIFLCAIGPHWLDNGSVQQRSVRCCASAISTSRSANFSTSR